jgi:hypothetical protein
MKRWGWLAFGVVFGALFVGERRRPLRRQKEPGLERVGRNVAIGLLAGATTAASELPLMAPVQRLAERGRLGLLRQLPLPRAVRTILGFLLLDYTLYLWHRLNHRAPFLWRFHAVHHVDLDLDSTTGLRFHFGADRDGGAAERGGRDPEHARHPPLDSARRNRLELLQPALVLGQAAPQLAARCTAGRRDDRCRRVLAARGCHAGALAHPAVS